MRSGLAHKRTYAHIRQAALTTRPHPKGGAADHGRTPFPPGRTIKKRFARSPIAPRLARNALAEWLGYRLSRDQLQSAKLAVGELVMNAVTHGTGEVVVHAHLDENSLRVAVIDQGSGFAYQHRPVSFDQPVGNGLAIVDALASRWGIQEGSTHVWFELDDPSAVP